MTRVTSADRHLVSGHNGPMGWGTSGQEVQIIAHRGASSQCLENTVAAFLRARELGADAVELDVRYTADGVVVVHHDPVLPDGRALIETRRDDLPHFVPTLTEALDACEGMWVNVEIKHDPSEPGFDPRETIAFATAELLARRPEPVSRWLVSSFRRETIDAVHAAEPELATAWLCLELDGAVAASLAADGHVAAHPWVERLTPEVIAACHGVGLRVNTWTCDDPNLMQHMIASGVDGLCTNVPDVGRQVRDTGITSRSTSGS
jgi:glycerophosphoryl diester phosphodiesterase